MARALYLHEVIDIVGDKAVEYMEQSVLGFKTDSAADRGLDLWGTWYVMGSTGRWPQVVTLWEMAGGWDDWERLCRSTNLRREANTELNEWWLEALARRTGGFDRLLGDVGGTVPLSAIAEEGVEASLFVHELTTVAPGAGPAYLDALRSEWAPVAGEYGHRLVGCFEVLMSDTEVCTVWATSLEDHVALGKATDVSRGFGGGPSSGDTSPGVGASNRSPGAGGSGRSGGFGGLIDREGDDDGAVADVRIAAWWRHRSELTVRWREELMVPCPGTPMGPATWPT